MVSIARETLKFTNPDGPLDELVDTFHSLARQCRRAAELVEYGIPDRSGTVPKLLAEADSLVNSALADFARAAVAS